MPPPRCRHRGTHESLSSQAPYANTLAVIKALTAKAMLLDYADVTSAFEAALYKKEVRA